MGIYDRDHRQNDPWKKTPKEVKKYKISDFKNINTQKGNKPINNWIFAIPVIFLLLVIFFRNN